MSDESQARADEPLRPFAPRVTTHPATTTSDDTPTARELFAEELNKIEARIQAVIAGGRSAFVEGADTYDRASMAVIRLAALFEDDKRFGGFLTSASKTERDGIRGTRNIAGRVGYAAMRDEVFWATVTVQIPAFLTKIRAANGL